jgi:hypothetical protein
VRKTGETPCGREGRSSLGRVSKGQALRTGHRSARGVAQDAPFLTAARLERRAGALTGTGSSYKLRFVIASRLNYSGSLLIRIMVAGIS